MTKLILKNEFADLWKVQNFIAHLFNSTGEVGVGYLQIKITDDWFVNFDDPK